MPKARAELGCVCVCVCVCASLLTGPLAAKQIGAILSIDEAVLVPRLVAAHDPIPALLRQRGLFAERVLVLSKSEEYSRARLSAILYF